MTVLLLLVIVFTACQKTTRSVVVYKCTCTLVMASNNKDTSETTTVADIAKGTAKSYCDQQKSLIVDQGNIKDAVSCNLY